MSAKSRPYVAAGALLVLLTAVCVGCWGGGKPDRERNEKGAKAERREKKDRDVGPAEPVPSLLVVQAQFTTDTQDPKPQPARLQLLRFKDGTFTRQGFSDPDSNVFHKAVAWRDGILTIGAEKALVKHWKKVDGKWAATVLWEKSWGGKFDRVRDIELGDVDGDGKEDLVVATHDAGVVAVGREQADGTWAWTELDQKADTFVHEIEIGDVDGDGKLEFYATPSGRNQASGASQPGSVYRYDFADGAFTSTHVVDFTESHAKEILVDDVDGDGKDELYVVREGHVVEGDGGAKQRLDPVRVVRYTPDGKGGWGEQVVATLDDDQCRFLLAGDVDHDGKKDLVAASMKAGVFVLRRAEDGTFASTLIDGDSGGFEHATHVADLDADGKLEVYVAADDQKEFRRYVWNGSAFTRTVIAPIGPKQFSHITWNIQDGVF